MPRKITALISLRSSRRRRSMAAVEDGPGAEELTRKILEAGVCAPSAETCSGGVSW